MITMKDKMKAFFKQNYLPLLFALTAILIELTAVFATSGDFYIRSPWMYLTLILLLTLVQYFFTTNHIRHIFSSIVLAAIFVFDLVFIVIFEMTGTIFDYSMLHLRSDAMAILESVPINFTYTTVGGILLSAFVAFAGDFNNEAARFSVGKIAKRILSLLLILVLTAHTALTYAYVAEANDTEDIVENKLYKENVGGYTDMGIMGNFLSEMYQGAFDEVEVSDPAVINDFIYRNVAGDEVPYFGAAEGYNVVTILAESFEWFSFLRDDFVYPNGHKADEAVLRELYPNLYEFYDSSVTMTNFHSREKTDISENLSIIGNYPLDYYLNYDYPENNIAFSLPNVMKLLYDVDSGYFHNGTNSFYNRETYIPNALGFASFAASGEMVKKGMTDYFDLGERNLDSEMIEVCKEEMFPTDRRFNTNITTITMHGQYAHRDNLQQYYDILDEKGLLPLQEGIDEASTNANTFRYYAAAAMEFDRAIGVMMDYLKETGLIDHTIVLIFGDHNVYYQSLSNYVKDIYPRTNPASDITELYRVPLMIKIGNQTERVTVDKFCCTADILPTLQSLLGIRYYSNLYYGHSVFSDEESILYSRAYDVFMTDKEYFVSLDSPVYVAPDADEAYLADVEARAVALMEKVSYINQIYAANFFSGEELNRFEENMLRINQ